MSTMRDLEIACIQMMRKFDDDFNEFRDHIEEYDVAYLNQVASKSLLVSSATENAYTRLVDKELNRRFSEGLLTDEEASALIMKVVLL